MEFLKNQFLLLLLVLILAYIIAYFSFYYFLVLREKKKKYKFFNTLKEGLKIGTITTLDDVVIIYKGVFELGAEDLNYRYKLSRQLREFLVELISKKLNGSLSGDVIKKWNVQISEFVKRNEEISPYAALPPAERNILVDISTFLEKGDVESVKRKISLVADMIQGWYKRLTKDHKISIVSSALAVIGLILTIISAIITYIAYIKR